MIKNLLANFKGKTHVLMIIVVNQDGVIIASEYDNIPTFNPYLQGISLLWNFIDKEAKKGRHQVDPHKKIEIVKVDLDLGENNYCALVKSMTTHSNLFTVFPINLYMILL